MAKFDISPVNGDGDADCGAESCGSSGAGLNVEDTTEANYEPDPRGACLHTDSTRMRRRCKGLGPVVRGFLSPGVLTAISACFLGVTNAAADPVTATTPEEVPRRSAPTVPTAPLRPSTDLDGTYLWLGPIGAASRLDGTWDSTFGAHAAVLRVREGAWLGTLGGAGGASLWTERGGGRIWLDAVVGTRLAGRMVGLTAGPLVELSDVAHPRWGGTIGAWGFAGVTPFVRVGIVQELGGFGEVGIHLALPVIRR